jgi:RES domain-containing protein
VSRKFSARRITKRKHARNAFSGEGAREFGGRWNNPGTAIVYTAQSQSLAALEMLVHLDSSELLENYVLLEVAIEDALVAHVDLSRVPKNWRDDPPPVQVRAIGDEWALAGSSAVLRVPSTLVPGENNFLLNPYHPDFTRLRISKPLPFHFDPRLLKKT